jgi:hypothetical protein
MNGTRYVSLLKRRVKRSHTISMIITRGAIGERKLRKPSNVNSTSRCPVCIILNRPPILKKSMISFRILTKKSIKFNYILGSSRLVSSIAVSAKARYFSENTLRRYRYLAA